MASTARAVVRSIADIEPGTVGRARKTSVQVLLGEHDGAPSLSTRMFTIQPGGRIPCHRHDATEHQQIVLEGQMVISLDGAESVVSAGSCVFIPPGVAHWYENRGAEPARFVCVVPRTTDDRTEWLEAPLS